jgi:hypothetical protein
MSKLRKVILKHSPKMSLKEAVTQKHNYAVGIKELCKSYIFLHSRSKNGMMLPYTDMP